MSGSSSYSFRVQDAVIEQQLDAMADRSEFIRQAVAEKLSADAVHRDDVRRLREGLASIANSTELILEAGGDDIPELVSAGLTGIREAAAILAAEPQGREHATPETGTAMAVSAAAAVAGASPPKQPELKLCTSVADAHRDPEPDPDPTNPTRPNQEDPS